MPSPTTEVIMGDTNFNPHQTKKYPNRRQAAGFSAIGGAISYIPAIGKFLSVPFMFPDLLYDAYDLYKERKKGLMPTLVNAGHLALDFPSYIPGMLGDDALEIGGIIDDGTYAITGKPIEEHIKNYFNSKSYKKRRSLANEKGIR